MAGGGPPAPQPPTLVHPVQPVVLPAPPAQLVVPPAQPDPLPQLTISHILNQNFQVSQMKIQKLIFLEQMTGWIIMYFQKVPKSKCFA